MMIGSWVGIWAGALSLMAGCVTDATTGSTRCQLPAPIVEPAEAAAGAEVSVRTEPLSATWDSAVLIGPTRAEITGLLREGCDACDACKEAAGCFTCGDCAGCEADCASCVQSLTVTVPDLPAGAWPVSVLNHYGEGAGGSLSVIAADTGADTAGDTAGDTADSAP